MMSHIHTHNITTITGIIIIECDQKLSPQSRKVTSTSILSAVLRSVHYQHRHLFM